MSANYDRAASFMRDLGDVIAQQATRKLNLSEQHAKEFGMECAHLACDGFSGEMVYVPNSLLMRIDARDRELYAFYEANKRDIVATAHKFELSVPHTYRRIRMIELTEFNERQGGLFGDDE